MNASMQHTTTTDMGAGTHHVGTSTEEVTPSAALGCPTWCENGSPHTACRGEHWKQWEPVEGLLAKVPDSAEWSPGWRPNVTVGVENDLHPRDVEMGVACGPTVYLSIDHGKAEAWVYLTAANARELQDHLEMAIRRCDEERVRMAGGHSVEELRQMTLSEVQGIAESLEVPVSAVLRASGF